MGVASTESQPHAHEIVDPPERARIVDVVKKKAVKRLEHDHRRQRREEREEYLARLAQVGEAVGRLNAELSDRPCLLNKR